MIPGLALASLTWMTVVGGLLGVNSLVTGCAVPVLTGEGEPAAVGVLGRDGGVVLSAV